MESIPGHVAKHQEKGAIKRKRETHWPTRSIRKRRATLPSGTHGDLEQEIGGYSMLAGGIIPVFRMRRDSGASRRPPGLSRACVHLASACVISPVSLPKDSDSRSHRAVWLYLPFTMICRLADGHSLEDRLIELSIVLLPLSLGCSQDVIDPNLLGNQMPSAHLSKC